MSSPFYASHTQTHLHSQRGWLLCKKWRRRGSPEWIGSGLSLFYTPRSGCYGIVEYCCSVWAYTCVCMCVCASEGAEQNWKHCYGSYTDPHHYLSELSFLLCFSVYAFPQLWGITMRYVGVGAPFQRNLTRCLYSTTFRSLIHSPAQVRLYVRDSSGHYIILNECLQCSYLTGEMCSRAFSIQKDEFIHISNIKLWTIDYPAHMPVFFSPSLFFPTHASPSGNSITFNHFSLISHLIFSSVSSWTRLGSSQSEDIISDYNSCGRQLLSQLLARKCRLPIWVPTASFVSLQCWRKYGWMDACVDYWMDTGPDPRGFRALGFTWKTSTKILKTTTKR